MTNAELIHTKQEGSEWTVAAKRQQMTERYTRRKSLRRERKLRLEERNEALRKMMNRK